MRVKDVVHRALAGYITWKEAENFLSCSARHVRRLRKRVMLDLNDPFEDKRNGRKMPKRIETTTINEILSFREKRYHDFNIKHFHEKLKECHNIHVSYTYLKVLLQNCGYAEKAPGRGKHRCRRDRRPMAGMMLHMDASMHAWLGPDHGKRDLICVVDDATSEILYVAFTPEEDTRSCLLAVQNILKIRGLFHELYTDRGSHFICTPKAGEKGDTRNVQFARVLKGLKIQAIYAKSPQARGRSERAFRTIQGRLPQELREEGIEDWDAASEYIKNTFMPDWNQRFTVPPAHAETAFTPIVGMDIERHCALEYEVTVGADNCVRRKHRCYQIPRHPTRPSFARCKATLVEYLDGRVDIEYGRLTIAQFPAPQKQSTNDERDAA